MLFQQTVALAARAGAKAAAEQVWPATDGRTGLARLFVYFVYVFPRLLKFFKGFGRFAPTVFLGFS